MKNNKSNPAYFDGMNGLESTGVNLEPVTASRLIKHTACPLCVRAGERIDQLQAVVDSIPLPYFLAGEHVGWGIDKTSEGYVVLFGDTEQAAYTPQRYPTFGAALFSIELDAKQHATEVKGG